MEGGSRVGLSSDRVKGVAEVRGGGVKGAVE